MDDIQQMMDRLTDHIIEHGGKFSLYVAQDYGAGPPVWAVEMVNDIGSYLCTSHRPHKAIESLLGVIHA